jgi:hypothetical protein
MLFSDNNDTLPPTKRKKYPSCYCLKSSQGSEKEFLKDFWHKRDIRSIPESIREYPLFKETSLFMQKV